MLTHIVLRQLAVLDQRFAPINRKYKGDEWSIDFYKRMYQALWSNDSAVLSMPSQSPEDWDEDCAFFLLILHKM